MVEEQKYPDFAARLNGLISMSDISITQLSEKTGVTYEMVRRYTLGTAKPRTPTMRKLSAVLGVDAAYLEYGVGKPSEGEAVKSIASNPLQDVYRVEVLDLTVSAGPGNYMISDYVEVLYAIEFTTEHARVLFGNRDPADVKVMTVNGDSMALPLCRAIGCSLMYRFGIFRLMASTHLFMGRLSTLSACKCRVIS
jgi:transcriptional regulator with XRE-family HTH domain